MDYQIEPSQLHLAGMGQSGETSLQIKQIADQWLLAHDITDTVKTSVPEFNDRTNGWIVVLVAKADSSVPIGELVVQNSTVTSATEPKLITDRVSKIPPAQPTDTLSTNKIEFTALESRIQLGDSKTILANSPSDSVQLAVTSPPYYNAKPEYHESASYDDYLDLLRQVFTGCHHVLSEGRFLVVNTSPVIIKRVSRSSSSKRIPIPFDLHGILDKIGFDFIDDIVWVKPAGAGWSIGRGRSFAKDRQPLQYKPVPVTENVMVYRKRTERLIDWNIRNHPNPDEVEQSLVDDGYEATNVWEISPASHGVHPAVFPDGLVERVVKYYSFVGDMVLDPFAGTGTTARVAAKLNRRFWMIEQKTEYFDVQKADLSIRNSAPLILQ